MWITKQKTDKSTERKLERNQNGSSKSFLDWGNIDLNQILDVAARKKEVNK